jgi:hypothetical protein
MCDTNRLIDVLVGHYSAGCGVRCRLCRLLQSRNLVRTRQVRIVYYRTVKSRYMYIIISAHHFLVPFSTALSIVLLSALFLNEIFGLNLFIIIGANTAFDSFLTSCNCNIDPQYQSL